MTEDQENVSAEAETPVVQGESEIAQEREAESQAQQRKRNDVEYNWAEANRKMQELQRQNKELAEAVQKMQQPKVAEIDELDKLGDDDIITKAGAKKLAEKMARQIAAETIRQREAETVEERLQNKYPDFASVVSRENIDQLKTNDPELAMSLHRLSDDPFAQGVAAYKLLMKLGYGDNMSKSVEKKKAIENSQKPISVNAATKSSALGNAHLFENGLTKELKTQLWKEMQQAMKGA